MTEYEEDCLIQQARKQYFDELKLINNQNISIEELEKQKIKAIVRYHKKLEKIEFKTIIN